MRPSTGRIRARGLLLIGLAVALCVAAAPAAHAVPLPLVSSTTYATAADDAYTCVTTGPDGAVYAAGYAQKDGALGASVLLLVKYVDDGTALSEAWHTIAGSGQPMTAVRVAVDASGNLIVAGNEGPFAFHGASSDIAVVKFSPAGEELWRTTYDGPAHKLDYVTDLELDGEGNAVVCGASTGRGTGRDYVTIKVTAGGQRAWARRHAGPTTYDEARSVALDPAGNVYVTGSSRYGASIPRRQGPPRAVTISYSPTGQRRWTLVDKRGGTTSGSAVDYCALQGAEGIVVTGVRTPAGQSYEHIYFAMYRTADASLLWSRTPTSGTKSGEWSLAAALDESGAPVAAGYRIARSDMRAWLTGVSDAGRAVWQSAYDSTYQSAGIAEFDAVAVGAGGGLLAAGSVVTGYPRPEMQMPTTFLVRYSPDRPVTAPLDYVGAGSATSHDACKAVAIGDHGMYAVGLSAEGDDDSDAVLLKF
jgi:hypothetical protein